MDSYKGQNQIQAHFKIQIALFSNFQRTTKVETIQRKEQKFEADKKCFIVISFSNPRRLGQKIMGCTMPEPFEYYRKLMASWQPQKSPGKKKWTTIFPLSYSGS